MKLARSLLVLGSFLVVSMVFGAEPAYPAAPPAQGAQPSGAAAQKAALDDIQSTFGFVPGFFKAMPAQSLPGVWAEMKDLQMSPKTALPPKYKELIGLAVASQIPCQYCIYAHTELAKSSGATQEEINTAVAEAGLTRHWSTFTNGMQIDETKFRADVTKMVERMKKMEKEGAKAAPPAEIAGSASALKDIERAMGFVPEFMKKFPAAGLPGAWKEWRDVEMTPGPVPAKYLSAIGLGVSAQIPCHYCIIADTEMAKANGATPDELAEAIGIAAHTRNMSTLLNGLQMEDAAFRADIQKMIKAKGKTASR